MTDAIWLPGLVVLALGVGAGLLVAWRLGRGASPAAGASTARDLQLRLEDLEARRRDLYRRLRAADAEGLSAGERRTLERSAAWTLKAMDRLRRQLPPEDRRRPRPAPAAAAAAGPRGRGGLPSRHPMVSGFLLGAGMVALLGVLIYWAVRDAGPRPGAAVAAPPTEGMVDPHPGEGSLPPEAAAREAELQQRLDASPRDLMAMKELSLLYVTHQRLFDAYELALSIEELQPGDPDALYIQGVVRLAMGQEEVAVELLSRVLEEYPDHLQALVARGLAEARRGNMEAAVASWEAGLELAGGSQPDLERLLRMARGGSVPGATAPPPVAAPPEAGAPAFPLEIRLAEGFRLPAGMTLFVSLRGEAPGPPAAVRRVDSPAFPLAVELSSADSMLGRPLPSSGTVTVRLDGDGDASTREEGDVEVRAEVESGRPARLILGG